MPDLTKLIDRFEAALKACGPALTEAEAALCRALSGAIAPGHDAVCEPLARGCTEGVSHRGTVYAPGFGPGGEPAVVVIRRVRDAADFNPVTRFAAEGRRLPPSPPLETRR
jgi:hypothetical protein